MYSQPPRAISNSPHIPAWFPCELTHLFPPCGPIPVNEEKLKIAVFIDFDNIQIGVRSTLARDFDLALVLEALKERGEVVTKIAYGNWKRAGELTRTLTHNAVLMVQRDLTPRGDKNGADINLALDALEMAINHPHINAFVIVGGDSDFIALVEKLKTYNKAVFVVGGRAFTSSILQRNCREFLAYENLIESTAGERRREVGEPLRRREVYPLQRALSLLDRALKMLSDREVQPQLGLLKSTLKQLDSTFDERDYGANSFRVLMQRMADAKLIGLRQQGNSYVVDSVERDAGAELPAEAISTGSFDSINGSGGASVFETTPSLPGEEIDPEPGEAYPAPAAVTVREPIPPSALRPANEAVQLLATILEPLRGTNPRPLYLRNVKQLLRAELPGFDEQTYGFASLVDLLRAGQTQNLLRLQRDRRGALRVFIPSVPGAGPAPVTDETGREVQEQNAGADTIASTPAVTAETEESQPSFAAAPLKVISEEDSQIAVLGFYRGLPGEDSGEPDLALAAAVAAEAGGGRKKRAPRKPKPGGGGGGPRRRKPPVG